LGRKTAFAAQVDLNRAAPDAAPDHLLELRLEEVIRFGGAQRHLEVTVVQGTQLEGDVDLVALVMGLAVSGHAQQHTNLGDFRLQISDCRFEESSFFKSAI